MSFSRRLLIIAILASLDGVAFGDETSPEIAVTVIPASPNAPAETGHQAVWVGIRNRSSQTIYFMFGTPWISSWQVENPHGSIFDWIGFSAAQGVTDQPRLGERLCPTAEFVHALRPGSELRRLGELDVSSIPVKEVALSVDVELIKAAEDLRCAPMALYRGTGTGTVEISQEIAVTVSPAARPISAKAGRQMAWVGIKNISPQTIYFIFSPTWIRAWTVVPQPISIADLNLVQGDQSSDEPSYRDRVCPLVEHVHALRPGGELRRLWAFDLRRRVPTKQATLTVEVALHKVVEDLECAHAAFYRGMGTATMPVTGHTP